MRVFNTKFTLSFNPNSTKADIVTTYTTPKHKRLEADCQFISRNISTLSITFKEFMFKRFKSFNSMSKIRIKFKCDICSQALSAPKNS